MKVSLIRKLAILVVLLGATAGLEAVRLDQCEVNDEACASLPDGLGCCAESCECSFRDVGGTMAWVCTCTCCFAG